MIAHIIYNITTPSFQTTVELIKRDLNRQNPVKLHEVQDDIRQVFGQLQQQQHRARMQHNRNRNQYQPNDSLLAAGTGFKKKTKSLCRICGKMGHKGTDCWDHPNNQGKPRPPRGP